MNTEEALLLGSRLKAAVRTYLVLLRATKPMTQVELMPHTGLALRGVREHLLTIKYLGLARIVGWTSNNEALYALGGGKDAPRAKVKRKPRGKASPKTDQVKEASDTNAELKAVAEKLRVSNQGSELLVSTAHGHKVVVGNVTRHVMR